jgi:hypothetical protein
MSSSPGQPIRQERENGDSENREIIHDSAALQSVCTEALLLRTEP